jgi:outer membrane protein assembly factor BamA
MLVPYCRRLAATLFLLLAPGAAGAQAARPVLGLRDSMDVATVVFEGDSAVSASDLRGVIFTRPSPCRLILFYPACKLFPTGQLFIDRRRTTPKALGEDITALRVYYWRRGYREAAVDTVVTPAPHGRVAITFRITEGEPTRVASLDIVQRTPVLTAAELEYASVLRPGDPFSLITLDTVVSRLRDLAWNHGHGDVRVDTTVPRPDAARRVPVRIDVDPRWPTRVGSVEFTGNVRLSDETLQRAMLLTPGAPYTRNAVLESERRLFQTPALARALVVVPPPGDSIKRVTVAVTETATQQASATLGFNTIDFGQAGVQLRHNALGSGRWLELRAVAGNLLGRQLNGRAIFREAVAPGEPGADVFLRPTYQASATLTQPWIAGPRTSANVSLFAGRRSLPGVVVDENAGVSLGVVRELAVQLPVGLHYRMESTRVRGSAVYFCAGYGVCDAPTVATLSERQRLARVGASAWIDRSDDLEVPSRGYTAVADVEHASRATGSTFMHDRVAIDGSYYKPFGVKPESIEEPELPLVLALHGRTGWVRPNGVLHPRARFYAGGMQSVRGFAENDLGPRVLQARRASLLAGGCTGASIASGDCDPSAVPSSDLFTRPTGGSTLVEGSVELRVPLSAQLGAVVFMDGAYVGTAGLAAPIARGAGAVTPGGGFRYRSPLGVLRLDLGLRPTGGQSLPVVVAVPDASGEERIVRLAREKVYSPLDPSPGFLRSIGRRLVVHFAMGQAF